MHLMDLLLTCERGCAPYVQKELEVKKIGKSYKVHETALIAKECTKEALIRAAYTLQTPTRICWLLGTAEVDVDTEETIIALETLLGTLEYEQLFFKDKSSFVFCHREGTHEYNSVDASQEAGRLLKRHCNEALKFVPEVDMKKPDILFYLHIDQKEAFFGIDLLGYDNAKRSYKVFNNPHSIKGTTASCLLMAAEWNPKLTLLDPFCAGGVIAIEAALMATGRSHHFFDKKLSCKAHPLFAKEVDGVIKKIDANIVDIDSKLISAYDATTRNVAATKKNAKIAGVEKLITFSRTDAEWLDTKFSSKSLHKVITQPLEASKHVAKAKALQVNKELFYACDYVLAKDGNITFLCQHPEDLVEAASGYKFSKKEQVQVFTGKLPLWLVTFVRD